MNLYAISYVKTSKSLYVESVVALNIDDALHVFRRWAERSLADMEEIISIERVKCNIIVEREL